MILFGVSSVSYVAISGEVMERVVRQAAETPDKQVVGVLLGGRSGDGILVDDATTGPSESDSVHVTLPGDSIARIADDIINKRIRGSIVGWYHSHVRGGVFMSETDVETQLKLQQFSPMVAAMVIDAQTGKAGFFRADSKTKGAIPVRHETRTPTVPMPAPSPQAYYPQAPQQPAPLPVSTRTIVLAVLLITLAVTGGIIALAYYRPAGGGGGNLAIKHTPPAGPLTIAFPITFDANVTGYDLKNVTLSYRVLEQAPSGRGFNIGDLVQVPMLLKAAGKDTYSYTLQSSSVSGVYVNYYISAFDGSGNVVRSDVYNLNVGDFRWKYESTDVIVTRTIVKSVQLELEPINGFQRAVKIKVVGQVPLGVQILSLDAQVIPPSPARLEIRSTDNAQLVTDFEVEIDAVYSPPGVSAVQIIRSTILKMTVTDFDLDVAPIYAEVRPNHNATYTMTMKVYDGFTTPNGFTFYIDPAGLPDKAYWRLMLVDYRIDENQQAIFTFDLIIHVPSGTKTNQLYLFDLKITAQTVGGTITHTKENIQLKVV